MTRNGIICQAPHAARLALAALALVLAACTAPAPVKTFSLASPSGPDVYDQLADTYELAASAWCDVGVCQVGGWNDLSGDVVIYLERVHGLASRESVGGIADRSSHYIAIDDSLAGFDLCIAVAHEVGHVALNTPTHVVGGVMGGADCHLNAADRELACETVGACE